MKKVKCLFAVIALLAFAACEKETPVVPEIKVEKTAYDVGEAAQEFVLPFKYNCEYVVETTADWIQYNPQTKSEFTDGSASFSVEQNLYTEPRVANIEFYTIDNRLLQTVEVTQFSHEPSLKGFYFLNEGQWGKNNAQLDYYNLLTNEWTSKWWLSINPDVRGGLGDVGNDMVVSYEYLFIVLNNSNLIEVSKRSGEHVTEIEVPNPRKLLVLDNYLYITSYAKDGVVYRVDLTTLKLDSNTCKVDYEPEGICELNGVIYVANSGGYHSDNYGHTVSVIDPSTFTVIKTIDVKKLNLYGAIIPINESQILVSASGNYTTEKAATVVFDTNGSVVDTYDFPSTYAHKVGDSVYTFGTSFSYYTFEWEVANYIWNPSDLSRTPFLSDEEVYSTMGGPSDFAVDPLTGDIYLADMGNYTTPGFLYIFDKDGKQKNKIQVGVCPGHIIWDWR